MSATLGVDLVGDGGGDLISIANGDLEEAPGLVGTSGRLVVDDIILRHSSNSARVHVALILDEF